MDDAVGAAQELETRARDGGNAQTHVVGAARDRTLPAGGQCPRRGAGLVRPIRRAPGGRHRSDRRAEHARQPRAGAVLVRGHGRRYALARRTLNEVRAISRPMGHAMTTGLAHIAEVMVQAFAHDPRSSDCRADARGSRRFTSQAGLRLSRRRARLSLLERSTHPGARAQRHTGAASRTRRRDDTRNDGGRSPVG